MTENVMKLSPLRDQNILHTTTVVSKNVEQGTVAIAGMAMYKLVPTLRATIVCQASVTDLPMELNGCHICVDGFTAQNCLPCVRVHLDMQTKQHEEEEAQISLPQACSDYKFSCKAASLDAALGALLLGRHTWPGAQQKITDFLSLWKWDIMQNFGKNLVQYVPMQTLRGTKGVCGDQSWHNIFCHPKQIKFLAPF
jgi:hypothetical protein